MRPRPITSYSAPSYPTREQAAEDPALLREHLPPAWQADGRMVGAVAFFLTFATAGCHGSSEPAAPTGSPTGAPTGSPIVAIAPASGSASAEPGAPTPISPAAAPEVMAVAPIFEHGDGRGAEGCVVVAPPVFLSEEEALSIMREELGKSGVSLSKHAVELGDVRIPKRQQQYHQSPQGGLVEETVDDPSGGKPLVIDGLSPERNVAVKFVSAQEYFDLGGAHSGSSVQGYDLKGVATDLTQRLRKQGKRPLYVGVFYDPVSILDMRHGQVPDWQAAQAELREKSKVMLRQQVQDFVSWLRGKGAL
jgi:hypothetical protein